MKFLYYDLTLYSMYRMLNNRFSLQIDRIRIGLVFYEYISILLYEYITLISFNFKKAFVEKRF